VNAVDDYMDNRDSKDLVIAGCRVQLAFHHTGKGRWHVEGKVRCGINEHCHERSFLTEDRDSREAAEKEALGRVEDLLGHNVDRNTSRVKNWN
jgi:hypothetical protein